MQPPPDQLVTLPPATSAHHLDSHPEHISSTRSTSSRPLKKVERPDRIHVEAAVAILGSLVEVVRPRAPGSRD